KGDTGGEPSIASAKDGTLYVSYPASSVKASDPSGSVFYRSTNGGTSWKAGALASARGDSGDTTVNVDSTGAVYQSNLRYVHPDGLQIDMYKSLDKGAHWFQKGVTGSADNPSSDNSTNSTFLVDRQWTDAYVPHGKTTKDARVYITYHDFVTSLIWVNVSKDGGRTFSEQTNVVNDPAALANSACNTVPGGLRVVQSGPHAGRVYVVWLSGDLAENAATGCNVTQLATFGQIWSAYSDDEGATWTDQLVYDSGVFAPGDGLGLISIGHDASTLF